MNQFISTLAEQWPNYILEIIVIILGVLGAFMLNRWYDIYKESKKEKIYLQSLLGDLRNQMEEIKIQIASEKPILESLHWLGNIISKDFTNTTPGEVNKHLLSVFEIRNFNTIKTTFLDLQSSGNFEIIKDQKLKDAIHVFYQDMTRKARVIYQNVNHEIFIYSQGLLDNSLINIHPENYMKHLNPIDFIFNEKVESKIDKLAFNNLTKDENLVYLKNAISAKALIVKINLTYLEAINSGAKSLIADINSAL